MQAEYESENEREIKYQDSQRNVEFVFSLWGSSRLIHTPPCGRKSHYNLLPSLTLSQSLARTHYVRTPCQNTASGVLSGYKSCSYQCLKKAQAKEMQAVRASVPAGTLILRWTTTPDPQNTSLWQGIQANYLVNHLAEWCIKYICGPIRHNSELVMKNRLSSRDSIVHTLVMLQLD